MKSLYAYEDRELGVEGEFQPEVSISKAKVVANFIVVESGCCLLGYSTATDLGIVWIPWELTGQVTITLLMTPLWEDSKQNTPGKA